MSEMQIEPAEGYVVLEFLDEPSSDQGAKPDYAAPASAGGYNEACYAMCIGVGKKVTNCRRGDVVLVREYARDNGIKVSDDVVLCEAYLVVAVVKGN